MSETRVNVSPGANDGEVRLLDVAAVLLREWKVILGCLLVAALLGAAFAWTRPKAYTARTVLLPMAEAGGGGSFGGGGRGEGVAASIPMAALNLGSLASNNQKMISAVLESRSVREQVTALVAEGQPAAPRKTVRAVVNAAKTQRKTEDNSITVQVTSRDPELSARIANAYPLAVNSVVQRLISESAQRKQRFLERQLVQARERLVESEQELLRFQQRRDAPEVQEQARRTVEAAGQVQQEINEQEVRVAQLRRTLSAENPQLRAAEADLATRRAQLRRITSGGGGSQLYVPLSSAAGLRVATSRLTREFAKNEAIYNSLTAQLTQARIDSNNNLPAIGVLDPAEVPSTPSGGGKSIILIASVFLGLCIGLAAAFVRHQIRRTRRGDADAEPLFEAIDRLRSRAPGDGGGVKPNGRPLLRE